MALRTLQPLAIRGGPPSVTMPRPHFKWPVVTERTKRAILAQVEHEVSIYDRSGIFEVFEDRFANYHDRKRSLVCNSGTSALFGAFEGLHLGPGDEVIVPAYTFFATASPLMYLGVTPVFCDCDCEGNVDPSRLPALLTERTKAVVVTHMWGMPCDMPKIAEFCQRSKLKLVEDCSHAHGALIDGRKVGTFGDAAVWSLQGKKIVTGGEGGILLCDDDEIYYRALLQGQYNMRCRQEIPKDHPLQKYSLTGFGLKLRAHPFAIAMANEQFDHLEGWIEKKNEFAAMLTDTLRPFPFISTPQHVRRRPSWYAYMFRYFPGNAMPSVQDFFAALRAEGMDEIDQPGSTRPINNLPLFTKPEEALPRLYRGNELANASPECQNAETFFRSAIKLPVWAHESDRAVVLEYCNALRKVCSYVAQGRF